MAISDQKRWFGKARFGLFIHWGIYSLLGRGEQVLFREHLAPSEYRKLAQRFHLFDLESDPHEMHDLSDDPKCRDTRERLAGLLAGNLYGKDLDWVDKGRLVGEPDKRFEPTPHRGLSGQRGWR